VRARKLAIYYILVQAATKSQGSTELKDSVLYLIFILLVLVVRILYTASVAPNTTKLSLAPE
jgi:hypothetical protein